MSGSEEDVSPHGDFLKGGSEDTKHRSLAKAPLPRGSACVVCRKRKLRCTGERPNCANCKRLGHACAYGDPMHEKLMERNRDLEMEIKRLEEELAAYRLGAHDGSANQQALYTPLTMPHDVSPTASSSALGLDSSPPLDFRYADPGRSSSTNRGIPAISTAFSTSSLSMHQDADAFLLSAGGSVPSPFPFSANIPPQFSGQHHSPTSPNLLYPDGNGHSLHFHASPNTAGSVLPPVSPSYPGGSDPNTAWQWPEGPNQRFDGRQQQFRSPQPQEPQTVMHTWGGDLPPIALTMELAVLYFDTVHTHLPFLHRPRFLYSLNHPTAIASAPSLALTFAVLAIAAPYHDDASVRARAGAWYTKAVKKSEEVINMGTSDRGVTTFLTVETVQALCLLEIIEMGRADFQRASMTIAIAVRIASMLGLHRLDEDRIAKRLGQTADRRLRPPAVHPLPSDPLLLEECRRTMCTVFLLDRFESGCTGWPCCLSEPDIRLLAPCDDEFFEAGTCDSSDNPLFWPILPVTLETEDQRPGPKVGTFAWLCRVILIGARIQGETYRASGILADGPFRIYDLSPPYESTDKVLALDRDMNVMRDKLNAIASVPTARGGLNAPAIMSLTILNALCVSLHHLRAARIRSIPYNASQNSIPGSPEYSMSRCLEGIYSLHEILSQVITYENARTSVHRSRVSTFTVMIPYVLYSVAFSAKFTVGNWETTAEDRTRVEKVPAGVVAGETAAPVPSGDDVFGTALDNSRLTVVGTLCEALQRIGEVWATGSRFAQMISPDRAAFASKVHARRGRSPNVQGGL